MLIVKIVKVLRNLAILAVLGVGAALWLAPPVAGACAGTGWCGSDYGCCYDTCTNEQCGGLSGVLLTSCQNSCGSDCRACSQ